MRKRRVLILTVAASLVVGAVLSFESVRRRPASEIRSVLQKDVSSGQASDIAQRVAIMGSIDLSGCPADFATAYRSHIDAWAAAGEAKVAADRLRSRIASLDRQFGSMDGAYYLYSQGGPISVAAAGGLDAYNAIIRESSRVDTTIDRRSAAIHSTWAAVIASSRAHGYQPPASTVGP